MPRLSRPAGGAARAILLLLLAALLAPPAARSDEGDPAPASAAGRTVHLPLILNRFDPGATEPIPVPPPPVSNVARSGRWSDPATWGGNLPVDGAVVLIPSGVTVQLDTATPRLAGLTIDGTLAFEDRDLTLTSAFVMVHGTLQVGSEAAPFASRATIRLAGGPTQNSIMGMGSKFLGAMGGGTIRLHGASRSKLSWTKLAATASPGAATLTLAEAPGWAPGDVLVVAPTGMDPAQAERVTITAVSGASVSITPPLRFEHFGETQTFAGRTLDARASVGLLSRNIVITSEGVEPQATTSDRRFGGHVMVMQGGRAFIEGVEFRQLGQERHLGRYAFHWHLAGDVSGQYVRNSSVNTSFTRGIVVHGTRGARVENNVGYESHSHMFVFAEDGSEVDNIFRRNLGVLVRRLPEPRRIAVFDEEDRNRSNRLQDEHRPSVFWGLNLYNTIEGNVAAAAEHGAGFFFDQGALPELPEDAPPPPPGTFVFRDNTAHTNYGPTGGNDRYPPLTAGYGLFVGEIHPQGRPPIVFEGFTAFKNSIAGAWIDDRNHTLRGAMMADNASGVIISLSTVEDSVIVGRSANTNGETETLGDGFRSVGINTATAQGADKGPTVRNTTFINLADAAFGMRNGDLLPRASFSAITLVNTPRGIFFAQNMMGGGLRDLDGSLTGTGGARVVLGNQPLQAGPGCALRAEWNAYLCSDGTKVFGVFIDMLGSRNSRAWFPLTLTRDDGVSGRLSEEGDATGGFVLSGRTYRVGFGGSFSRSSYMLSTFEDLGASAPDQWVVIGVPLPGGQAFAYLDNPDEREYQPDPRRPLTAAASLAALQSGPAGQFFRDPATGVVYVKLVGTGAPEPEPIFICAQAGCR